MLPTRFNKIYWYNNKNKQIKKNITFNFSFISTLPPFIVNNVRFSFNSNSDNKKLLLKQSYILLTWFFYLTFIQQNLNNKNLLKFFVMPLIIKKFTLTKAPMAHKNWSKEQYKLQFYKIKITFNVLLKENNDLNSFNKTLLFFFLTKKTLPQLETNLFFLKNFNLILYAKDDNFFNFNRYITYKN
jgi:hypothetical protein